MGILRNLFRAKSIDVFDLPDDLRFGRYSDAYKPEDKYDAWDKAIDLFEEGRFVESFERFFHYLRDDDEDNVSCAREGENLIFSVYQGSKLITGSVGPKLIKAEAKVATAQELNIGFLRRMMELNFTLKYSRYALDDHNNLTLIFDSYLLDGSPYKMYYALKEIAVSADKQDDLLVSEFEVLKPINTAHIRTLPEPQKETKVRFLRKSVLKTMEDIDNNRLSNEKNSGAVGYMLLALAYKLDYLIKPEGELTEALERIHRIYFAEDDSSNEEKNHNVRKEFTGILQRTDEQLKSEMYLASSSFGITSPGSSEQLVSLIDREIQNMDWYVEHKHHTMAMAFPDYIAGYCLFNFAFAPPVKELLHLYYHITEPAYFRELGLEPVFLDEIAGNLDRKAILSVLSGWKERHRPRFQSLDYDAGLLSFESLPSFAKSYFLMIRGLDLTKVR